MKRLFVLMALIARSYADSQRLAAVAQSFYALPA